MTNLSFSEFIAKVTDNEAHRHMSHILSAVTGCKYCEWEKTDWDAANKAASEERAAATGNVA